jgi:hypothetical protein
LDSSVENFKNWVEKDIPLSKKEDFINGWTFIDSDKAEI